MEKQGQYQIILLGQQSLQNTLLLKLLRSNFGCQCTLQDSFPELHDVNSDEQVLFLIDALSFLWDAEAGYLDRLNQLANLGRIAFLNMRDDEVYDYFLGWKGLKGFFYEDTDQDLFVKGVNAILEGDYWFSRKLMARYLKNHRHVTKGSSLDTSLLTKKERVILQLVAKGETNEAIAKHLSVSVHTIKTHVYNIFRKIGVNNRIQAIKWMSENGREAGDSKLHKAFVEDNHYLN